MGDRGRYGERRSRNKQVKPATELPRKPPRAGRQPSRAEALVESDRGRVLGVDAGRSPTCLPSAAARSISARKAPSRCPRRERSARTRAEVLDGVRGIPARRESRRSCQSRRRRWSRKRRAPDSPALWRSASQRSRPRGDGLLAEHRRRERDDLVIDRERPTRSSLTASRMAMSTPPRTELSCSRGLTRQA